MSLGHEFGHFLYEGLFDKHLLNI